jgi:hypothetical protein
MAVDKEAQAISLNVVASGHASVPGGFEVVASVLDRHQGMNR